MLPYARSELKGWKTHRAPNWLVFIQILISSLLWAGYFAGLREGHRGGVEGTGYIAFTFIATCAMVPLEIIALVYLGFFRDRSAGVWAAAILNLGFIVFCLHGILFTKL